ncbi:hypothetical protein Bca101_003605 [Brassica carinata]
MKLHPETIACTTFEVAKVFVKADTLKVLPKDINFTKEGKQFTVKFYYPWLPVRCKLCDKWGHGEAVCALKGKWQKYKEGNGVKIVSPMSVVKVQEVDKAELGNERESSIKTMMNIWQKAETDEEGTKKESNKKEHTNTGGHEINVTSHWSLVSPAKVGRILHKRILQIFRYQHLNTLFLWMRRMKMKY